MKTILSVMLIASSMFLNAQEIEGRLVAKFQGQLDSNISGEVCLSVVEYYRSQNDSFARVGILETNVSGSICETVDENEEIDFDFSKLTIIKNQTLIKILSNIAYNKLEEDRFLKFYELK